LRLGRLEPGKLRMEAINIGDRGKFSSGFTRVHTAMRILSLSAFFCSCAALFALFSCQEEPGRYSRPEKGFSVTFPRGWEIKEDVYGLDVIALSPLSGPQDGFRENVSVSSSRMEKPLEPDQILEANLPSMTNLITDFKITDRGSQAFEGLQTTWIRYNQRQGKFRLAVRLWAVAGRSRAYLVHCTAERGQIELFEDQCLRIMQTLEVEK